MSRTQLHRRNRPVRGLPSQGDPFPTSAASARVRGGSAGPCYPARMKEARAAGAVLYARVSDPKQDKGGHNLPTQQRKLQDYCTRNGLSVLELFVDKDSARTTDRPEF